MKLLSTFFLMMICALYSITNFAQESCPMPIGMNLFYNAYWSREIPFANLMMQGSRWISTDINPNFLLEESKTESSFKYDAKTGYPLEVPITVAGKTQKQVLRRILALDNGGIMPTGNYILNFEGIGEVVLQGGDVDQLVEKNGNRAVYACSSKGFGDIILSILSSDVSNPVRNISVMLPGTENQTSIYNPAFLQKLEPFTTIRFLNWTQTNTNPIEKWEDRILPEYYDQSTNKGIAYEYILSLCNELKKNLWLNLPHAANAEYTEKLAGLLKEKLNSDSHIYLEYSNEVWNANNAIHEWIKTNGTNLSDELQYKYAQLAGTHFKTFGKTFDQKRMTRVMCGHQAFPNITERSAKGMEFFGFENDYDALSCTGNLSLLENDYSTFAVKGASLTSSEVHAAIRRNMQDQYIPLMREHKEIASRYAKRLITYESSVHASARFPQFGTPPAYAQAIYDSQNSDAEYDLYNDWIKFLREDIGVNLMMGFVLADNNKAFYGSYGHLDHIFQDAPFTKAYKALADNACMPTTSNESEYNKQNILVYPNPVKNGQQISFSSPYKIQNIKILNAFGQIVYNSKILNDIIDLPILNTGVYHLIFEDKNSKNQVTKIVVTP
jgi:hypothetical protein